MVCARSSRIPNVSGVQAPRFSRKSPLVRCRFRKRRRGSTTSAPAFREASQRDRSRTLLAVAASILLVATVAGWALLRNRNDNPPTQTAILDLRNRSVARGAETNPDEPPLEFTRTAKNLKILLPLGSSDGPYDVRIVTPSGEELAASSGTAKLNDHITSLEVVLPHDSLRSGRYLLQLRKPQLSWDSYSLILR